MSNSLQISYKLFLSMIVLGLIVLILYLWNRPVFSSIGIVDMQELIAHEAKLLMEKHNGTVPKLALQSKTECIKQVLQTYAQEKNVILFNKSAILGPSYVNHTQAVSMKLSEFCNKSS